MFSQARESTIVNTVDMDVAHPAENHKNDGALEQLDLLFMRVSIRNRGIQQLPGKWVHFRRLNETQRGSENGKVLS